MFGLDTDRIADIPLVKQLFACMKKQADATQEQVELLREQNKLLREAIDEQVAVSKAFMQKIADSLNGGGKPRPR